MIPKSGNRFSGKITRKQKAFLRVSETWPFGNRGLVQHSILRGAKAAGLSRLVSEK
jgi:hypothetical protein